MFKILILDSSKISRKALEAMISSDNEFEVIASVGSEDEAIKAFNKITPDVVVINSRLKSGFSDITFVKVIKELNPRTNIIVLTDSCEEEDKNMVICKQYDSCLLLYEVTDDAILHSAIKMTANNIHVISKKIISA